MDGDSIPPPAPVSSTVPTEEPSDISSQDVPPPPPEASTPKYTTAMTRLKALQDKILNHLTTQLRRSDSDLIRLNKLLTSPGGLSSFLSTLNYVLYLLAYLTRGLPPRTSALQSITRFGTFFRRRLSPSPSQPIDAKAFPSTAALIPPTPDLSTSLTNLGSLLSQTRMTLRLFSLVPLYAWTRSLILVSQPPSDRLLHAINLAQALSYMTFQALENVALLHDKQITRLRAATGSKYYWLWSCRFWTVGVSLDFVRLYRQAQLERQRTQESTVTGMQEGDEKKTEEEGKEVEAKKARDQKLWNELWTAGCWFPLCVHWSTDGGLKGMNGGIIGTLGLMAQIGAFKDLWAETLT